MMDAPTPPHEAAQPKWQPVPAVERRILGVLVEKAKTVPESYPMTLAGICTAANQKNNRFPTMQLEPDQLEGPLEHLRNLGALAMVQGSGRVEKFRHYLYEWLGVDKVEMAVMTELLLRGAQTEGELRQRASRMEPIADLATLRQVLDGLKRKNLIVSLTPDGRGHVLTHNLYEPRELEKLRREYEALGGAAMADAEDAEDRGACASPRSSTAHDDVRQTVAALRQDVDDLRRQLKALQEEIASLRR